MVFLGGPQVILEFLEWLEGLGAKDRAPTNFGDFWRFCGILEGLEWFRTYLKIFFKNRGPCWNFYKRLRTVVKYTTSSGGSV
jgi:hypothetical protein